MCAHFTNDARRALYASTSGDGRSALCISTPHICARSESPLQDFWVLFQQYFTAALLAQTNRGFVFMTQPEHRAQSSSSHLTPTLASFAAHHLFCLSADLPHLFCPFDRQHFEFLSNGFLPAFSHVPLQFISSRAP